MVGSGAIQIMEIRTNPDPQQCNTTSDFLKIYTGNYEFHSAGC